MELYKSACIIFDRSGESILMCMDKNKFTGFTADDGVDIRQVIEDITGYPIASEGLNIEFSIGVSRPDIGAYVTTHYFTAVVSKSSVGQQPGGPALTWVTLKQLEEEPELFVESDLTRYAVKKGLARYNFSTNTVTRIPFRPSKPY